MSGVRPVQRCPFEPNQMSNQLDGFIILPNQSSNQISGFTFAPNQSSNQILWSVWNDFQFKLLCQIFTHWEKIFKLLAVLDPKYPAHYN